MKEDIHALKEFISEEIRNFLQEQSAHQMKRYKVTYTSKSLGEPEFYHTGIFKAYDLDHLYDKFEDENDSGWEIVKVEEIK